MQYEELTDDVTKQAVLAGVKDYLGAEQELGNTDLEVRNARRFSVQPDGYTMSKKQYNALVEMVRADTAAMLEMLQAHGHLTQREASDWRRRWERVWEANLKTCNSRGKCKVMLS